MTAPEDLVQQWLAEFGGGDADVAHLMCDRHDPASTAARFISADDLGEEVLTHGELADESKRLATVLAGYGIGVGERVPVLLGKRRALVVTLVALWRLGAVHVPLFTAFATGAIELRVSGSAARVVITDEGQRAKVEPIEGITVLDADELIGESAEAEPLAGNAAVGGEGTIIQIYTSGTTGKPKGVPIPARALASFRSYLHFSVGVRETDVYWNAADPGWAYGLYYALAGPLAAGIPTLLYEGGFTPESTLEILRRYRVTNFASAPTMYRTLRASGLEPDTVLERASSAGEPLTPDVTEWAAQKLGIEVRDHYGQTETGMTICNHWDPAVAQPLKAGSMGQPLPGFSMGVQEGQIAVDMTASPLMFFSGYHEDEAKSAERFTGDRRWYLTADTGSVDEDGYYFFNARDDDVILAAGYRIGPFDVESVLAKHAAVAEVAVVGRPDPEGIRGDLVEAFVVTMPGVEHTDELEKELQTKVRDEYSKHAYPRQVHFVDELPKTPSGKIQRFLLRKE